MMDARLIAAIQSGASIVTASRRLARSVRERYALLQATRGVAAWETPEALPWDAWLRRLATQARWTGTGQASGRVLLSDTQELALWEKIIDDRDPARLLDAPAAAVAAREAWYLVQAWRLPDPGSASAANAEVRAFSDWMRAYHGACREAEWVDLARLPDAIIGALRAKRLHAPAEILLLGFDTLTPQQRGFLKSLSTLGTQLSLLRGARQRSSPHRLAIPDSEEELAATARWARGLLTEERGQTIGIVVPSLATMRQKLCRIFDDILVPGAELPSAPETPRPYNLSLGKPLSHYPVVRDALAVLELLRGRISLAELGLLLRSPHISGGLIELAARSNFDAWLRHKGFTEIRVAQVARLLSEMRSAVDTGGNKLGLQTLFHSVTPALKTATGRHGHEVWTGLCGQFLDAFGWPGDRKTDSAEFQTVQAFHEQMGEFARLDRIGASLSVDEALDTLRRHLEQVVFQPQSPAVQVQVLGLLETPGLEFDHLWVSGMDAETWPRAPRPNPFIPVEWQRTHKLPHGTAEEELAFARRITRRLLRSAPDVLISHALRDGDRTLSVSPLVRDIKEIDPAEVNLAELTDYRGALMASAILEEIADDQAPPLEALENATGGTRVLRLQAACPFRAFAEIRLGAGPLEEPSPGLSPIERGTLVHSALEFIWHQIGSREVLTAALASDYLEVQVWEIADKVLSLVERRRLSPLGERYRALEHQRLVRLLMRWLSMEQARADFTIEGTEVERTVEVGPLTLKTRVDRIDRIQDFGFALIDYKSGVSGPADWMGMRPNEPQLPLYAISSPDELAAILFARFKTGDQRFTGVARLSGLIPQIEAFDDSALAHRHTLSWRDLLPAWRDSLGALATGFAAGDARVDPKYIKATCRQCHLATLCRIDDRVTERIAVND